MLCNHLAIFHESLFLGKRKKILWRLPCLLLYVFYVCFVSHRNLPLKLSSLNLFALPIALIFLVAFEDPLETIFVIKLSIRSKWKSCATQSGLTKRDKVPLVLLLTTSARISQSRITRG